MTKDEFLKRYHVYQVSTKEEAEKEIEQMEIVKDCIIVPVGFEGLGWCLMLKTAADYLGELGIAANR
ncbi:hypothetical protein HYS94_02020 [Candidatus Daviesbacteria bacterium]|nr:hypothetical protein [Candidatus Daviesbacteria bacterium]